MNQTDEPTKEPIDGVVSELSGSKSLKKDPL
jgi:hypothetical protein